MYLCAPRQVYRRVSVSSIGYTVVTAAPLDERYVCVGYFHGCSHVFALGGGVHSAAEIRDTYSIHTWSAECSRGLDRATCDMCYGCRTRVLSLSRGVTVLETVTASRAECAHRSRRATEY